ADLAALRALGCRRRGPHRMAVDEGSEQPAVDEPGHGHVLRARSEVRDGLVAVPDGADVKTVRIEAPAAVAGGEIVGIEILDGFRIRSVHRSSDLERSHRLRHAFVAPRFMKISLQDRPDDFTGLDSIRSSG